MKTKLFFLTLLFTAISSHAAILTVSNNPELPAEYNTISDAYNAASPNDTLYIYPSFTTYGDLNSYKPLAIIGAGQVVAGGPISRFEEIVLLSEASGTILHGLSVERVHCVNLTSVTMERNTITDFYPNVQNAMICRNVIFTILGDIKNSLVASNIFVHVVVNSSANEGLIFSNNYVTTTLWINAGVVRNNIVHLDYGVQSSNTIFSHNIMSETGTLAESGCTLINNIITDNPQYIVPDVGYHIMDYPGLVGSNYPGPFANLKLADTSPGKNAGTDGTDIGIYGGLAPFVDGDVSVSDMNRYYPASAIPTMKEMTLIGDFVIPQTDTIQVNIKASKQN